MHAVLEALAARPDRRVTWNWLWLEWRLARAVVKPQTMRALLRRKLIEPVGRMRHGHRDHRITDAGREVIKCV